MGLELCRRPKRARILPNYLRTAAFLASSPMSRLALAAALLLAALPVAVRPAVGQEAGAGAPAESASVSGTVRDAVTGETLILANVIVEQRGALGGGTATNSQGFYVLTELPPGEVTFVASYLGYETRRLALSLAPGERRRFDFGLVPAAVEGGEIVVEARSDAPAARARLLEEEAAELVPLLLATLAEPHRALRHAALTVPAAPPPPPPVGALPRFDACRAGRAGEGL